jgi:hypothetical protein
MEVEDPLCLCALSVSASSEDSIFAAQVIWHEVMAQITAILLSAEDEVESPLPYIEAGTVTRV